jgi:hypothetical protein
MFLRETIRKKDGKEHRYFSVVESKRVANGRVVQRHLLYLGEINDTQERAWRKSIEVFDEAAAQARTLSLFPEDRCEGLLPDVAVVRLRLTQVRLHRPRQWGACWLTLTLWRELQLDRFWADRLPVGRKGTRWDMVLAVLVAYRLLSPGSEWRLHREWFERSALADLLGADFALADPHKLYACHDRLLVHKRALFDHLVARWRDLFNISFDVLLYDLTSTYFEADPPFAEGDKRRYGYSRDRRQDCVQVVIALVVTPEELPLAYEVLPGNTADNATLRGFLDRIERQYGKARRIWLMDRGIPTEATFAEMRAADPPVQYVVGTPKGRLTRLEQELLAKPWQQARPGVQVKLLPQDGEVYVFAQARSRGQGARHAPAPAQVAVEAARANRGHEAHARGAADEARRRTQPSPDGLALGPDRRGQHRFNLQLSARSQQAATGAAARQSHRERSRLAVELLPAVGGSGRGLQETEGRSRHPADLPSARSARRGAHLHRFPGLLPPRHTRATLARLGARAHLAQRAREVRCHPDDRRAHPNQ